MAEQAVKGKVVQKQGQYFLDVAGKMEALPSGLADERALTQMAGQEVEVFYSTPRPVVVGFRATAHPHSTVLCNFVHLDLHPGNLIIQPSPETMRSVAAKLLKEGVITKEVHDKIHQSKG